MISGVPISKRLVFVNSLSSAGARLINVALLLWLQRYLITRIPADEYALYPVFMSIMVFLLLVKTLLASGIVRYATDAKAKKDSERIERIVSTMFVLTTAMALVSLGIGTGFALNINRFITVAPQYTADAVFIAVVLVVSFSLQMLLSPFEFGLVVAQRFVLLNMIEVGVVFLRIGLLLVLLFGVSTRVIWVAVANEAAGAAGIVARYTLSRRVLPEMRFNVRSIHWGVGAELLSFGWWAFIGQAGHRMRTHADPIILNAFATSFDVVCFYLGNMVIVQLNTLMLRMGETVVPSLTAMNATEQHERLGKVYLRFNRLALLLFMLPAVPLMVFRGELITLYVGAEFAPAATVLLLLMANASLGKGYGMLYKLGIAKGRMKFLAITGLALQAGNLALTLVLVGIFELGAVGAALSTFVVGVGIRSVVLIPYSLRLAGVSVADWFTRTLLPGYLPAVIAGVLGLVLRAYIMTSLRWSTVGILIAVTCTAYLFSAYLFGLKREDKQDFGDLVLRFNAKAKSTSGAY